MADPQPHLEVALRHRAGACDLDLHFSLTRPWTILFGPSGSGKTTVLRAVMGLLRPASGRIVCRGTVLCDAAAHVFLPPHRRAVRIAPQSPALFPHRTIQENLLYGTGWPSKPRDRIDVVEEVLLLFRISALRNRMPNECSGGEQQRAGVARALAAATTCDAVHRPLLLLDEPFAGLETGLRDEIVRDLQAWVTRWGIPALSVTHDVAEAFQLGAEVIKLHEGRVVAQGPVEVVLAEERERLLAQLGAGRE